MSYSVLQVDLGLECKRHCMARFPLGIGEMEGYVVLDLVMDEDRDLFSVGESERHRVRHYRRRG